MRTDALRWQGVSLQLGEFSIREADLKLSTGEWLGLVGPTGAGKTVLLEVAAGFYNPTAGSIHRDGRDVTRVPSEQRRIGYVPQDDILFAHLDVRLNLLFSECRWQTRPNPNANTSPGPDPDPDFDRIVEGLEIRELLDRRVDSISGGEAQRVSTGRALLTGADVLLLDECTSALDFATRNRVGQFLRSEARRRRLSVVQVTHDPAEVARLADRVIEVKAGRIVGSVGDAEKETR